MGTRAWGTLAASALFGAVLLAVSASGTAADTSTTTYIVQMVQPPVATYDGGVAGLTDHEAGEGEEARPSLRRT